MRIRNVTIGIQSAKKGLKEFARVVDAARRGHLPKKPVREELYFVSVEAMRNVLTPRRVELLQLIRHSEPKSIYALARAARRDLKNVQDDVALLSRIGLIQLVHSKTPRACVLPRVDYDRLQLQIPISSLAAAHPTIS